jgi:hypothetical protein
MDPYVVARLITNTVCAAEAANAAKPAKAPAKKAAKKK